MASYSCRRCDYTQEGQWEDLCPGCNGLYRAIKKGGDDGKKALSTFAAAAVAAMTEYVPTGLKGLDYILSGGLVAGNVILFGGFRGSGKSTLLVAAADALSKRRKVAYASSEQSDKGIVQIAKRIGSESDNVVVLGDQKYIEDTLARVRQERPFLVVYDSLQKYTSRLSSGTPGSASQGLAVASAIKEDCRTAHRCAIIVNQMSRAGELKGGTDVEHDVDTIVVLAYPDLAKHEDAPGDSADGIRLLTVDKNRDGSENLKNYWWMHGEKDPRPGTIECVPAKSNIIDMGERRGKYSKRDRDDD